MHCDDLFELLTSPQISGDPLHDPLVASHLATCEACRQLAREVAPALQLLCAAAGDVVPEASGVPACDRSLAERFHGQVWGSPPECSSGLHRAAPGLPPAQPQSRPAALARSQAAGSPALAAGSPALAAGCHANAPECRRAASSRRRRAAWAVALLGTAAALVLMFTCWHAGWRNEEITALPRLKADSQGAFWVTPNDAAAMQLAAACLVHDAQGGPVASEVRGHRTPWRLDCCTRCHTAGSAARVAHVALSRVTAHCGVCHVE